eukprot:35253-Pelagomonas_calceolata.AAC.1
MAKTLPLPKPKCSNPETCEIETDPCKVAGIVEKVYADSMAAPSIKTRAYLPSEPQARRNYPWMDR